MQLGKSEYLASITGDSVITCDEIIEKTKTVPKYCSNNFEWKNLTCKIKKNLYLVAFLLINIALFIAFSISFFLIKYQAKQKHLLIYHSTSKLKEITIKNVL